MPCVWDREEVRLVWIKVPIKHKIQNRNKLTNWFRSMGYDGKQGKVICVFLMHVRWNNKQSLTFENWQVIEGKLPTIDKGL